VIPKIDHEIWLLERIREHGGRLDAFDGDSDVPERCRRMRAAILASSLQAVVAGNRGGKTETYAQAFERLYGEPLDVTAKPTRKRSS